MTASHTQRMKFPRISRSESHLQKKKNPKCEAFAFFYFTDDGATALK
jgi:hypothetical protein